MGSVLHTANLVIDVAWFAFLIVWITSAIGAKRTIRPGRSWPRVIMRLLVVVVILHYAHIGGVRPAIGYSGWLESYPAIPVAGTVLTAAGIAWAIWARVHIGRNWGMPMSRKEAPDLVTTGPYGIVRHPIYTGMLVAMVGTAMAGGMWWLIVVVPSALYFVHSARTEERMMLEQFPDQYPAYVQRTKMLIPFVY